MKTKLYTFTFSVSDTGKLNQYHKSFKDFQDCMSQMEVFILDMHKHGLFPITKIEILYEDV